MATHVPKLNLRQKLDRMGMRFAPFPNLSTQGSYNFISQIVRADGFDAATFTKAFVEDDPVAQLGLIPLLVHEFQHFEDHLLSAWGAASLRRLFTAMNGRVSNVQERLGELTAVHREVRDLHLNDYYTELYAGSEKDWDGQTWAYHFSTGAKVDAEGRERPDHPILFSKFDTRDGVPVCRVPITVASLFEVRAMAVEIAHRIPLIRGLPADAQLIEANLYPDQLLRTLYDPLMAKYTVVAHYAANTFRIKDVVAGFVVASRLAWIILNLTDELFDAIRIPESFNLWGERNDAAKAGRDRGYAFGLVLEHSRHKDPPSGSTFFDTVLDRAGLPNEATIYALADVARAASYQPLAGGPFSHRFADLASFSVRLGGAAAAVKGAVGYTRGITPQVLTGDGTWFKVSNAGLLGTFADPTGWVDDAFRIHNRFEEFIDACVV